MRHMVLAGFMVAALALPAVVSAQASNIGSVTLAKQVMADGKTLAPGTYQVRLASEMPPAVRVSRRTTRDTSSSSRAARSSREKWPPLSRTRTSRRSRRDTRSCRTARQWSF